MESEIVLIAKLFKLHRTREDMSYSSIYHGMYEDQAIELNNKLFKLTGKNYTDYSEVEIKSSVAEADLLGVQYE